MCSRVGDTETEGDVDPLYFHIWVFFQHFFSICLDNPFLFIQDAYAVEILQINCSCQQDQVDKSLKCREKRNSSILTSAEGITAMSIYLGV